IVGAERAVLEAIASAPSGRSALVAIGHDLAAGLLDVRDVLLNPDQEGLDLEGAAARVSDALRALDADALAPPPRAVLDVLTAARLEPEIVAGVVRGLREPGASAGDEEAAD